MTLFDPRPPLFFLVLRALVIILRLLTFMLVFIVCFCLSLFVFLRFWHLHRIQYSLLEEVIDNPLFFSIAHIY